MMTELDDLKRWDRRCMKMQNRQYNTTHASRRLARKERTLHFCPQPTNSDSDELFSMILFVYIDG